ncbi:MAG: pyridoxamine 5'-phosphate oxidase family protein [Candidatus Tumulicola sp.]
MLGELTKSQVEDVLRTNLIGRVGCHAFGQTYVVPITYAYDGNYIYAHTGVGMKLHMMRGNPRVCFEVDHMDDLANWSSVIAWGTFEELRGSDAERAMQLLVEQIEPRIFGPPGGSVHPRSGMTPLVFYRIKLEQKTGRFERRL